MIVSQISKFSKSPTEISLRNQRSDEKPENYLTHPTLGLLYSVGQLYDNVEIFTTIYANRFFFLVTSNAAGIKWEAISRQEARLLVEKHLSDLRRLGQFQEYEKLMTRYQQTFR